MVCTNPVTLGLPETAAGARRLPRPSLCVLLPARLREDDLLRRRDHLRKDDLRLALLPLREEERLARRALRVPAERAEDRPHRMAVQVVPDPVLVDPAHLADRRLEHLRGRESVGSVLGRELAAVRLLVRLQELLVPRVLRALRRRAPADGVEDPLGVLDADR